MRLSIKNLIEPAIVFFILSMIAGLVWLMIQEGKQWAAFSETHHCKKVGEMSGSTQTGVGIGVTANGHMGTVITTSVTPCKTSWLCDDGVTYWR